MIPQKFLKKTLPAMGALSLFLFADVSEGTRLAEENLPNPYHLVKDWAPLPDGRAWGELGSVTVDHQDHVWAIERCGANSCAGSVLDPILEFDASGKLLKSFGGGMLIFPHSLYVDAHENVWVVDERAATSSELAKATDAAGKGCVIHKFSPDGKHLMTIGTPGVQGNPPLALIRPLSVLVTPKGDVFVADGDPNDTNTNARIVKFSNKGTFLKTWGKRGTGIGEFNTPHSLAMDSRGRLFVADRDNNRIQIFDQNGKFLDQWKQFGNPTGIFIDSKDQLYVSDTQSGESVNPGYTRGIRIGSAISGVVSEYIPAFGTAGKDHLGRFFAGAEGVAADSRGSIYAAESRARLLIKYTKDQ